LGPRWPMQARAYSGSAPSGQRKGKVWRSWFERRLAFQGSKKKEEKGLHPPLRTLLLLCRLALLRGDPQKAPSRPSINFALHLNRPPGSQNRSTTKRPGPPKASTMRIAHGGGGGKSALTNIDLLLQPPIEERGEGKRRTRLVAARLL